MSELHIPAGPTAIDAIHAELARIWHDNARIPPNIRMQVETAVAEIAANIVEHAVGYAPGVGITMRVDVHKHCVLVQFTDTGAAATGELERTEMPDELAERGRGLALARSVLAALAYHRIDDTNHWHLTSQPWLPAPRRA